MAGTVFVSAGLTQFSAALLARLGVFPSDAVLASTLLTILCIPAVIVWGLSTRRPVVFAALTLGGSTVLSVVAELI